jgi:hypothetical protein
MRSSAPTQLGWVDAKGRAEVTPPSDRDHLVGSTSLDLCDEMVAGAAS